MKIILLSILTLSALAWKPSHWHYDSLSQTDFINSSQQASDFLQGFALGSLQAQIPEMSICTSYSMDFIKSLERDFRTISNRTFMFKSYAVTYLFSHLIKDMPIVIQDCHLKNTTIEIFNITAALFNKGKDF